MSTLPILTAPHPVLSRKARDVREDELGPELARLLSDMAETMYAAPGVGLAAPQVGDGRRVIVVDSGKRTPGTSGLLKMVNPKIIARSREKITWDETCLSVPDFEVNVERHKNITVRWLTAEGEPKEADFHDFEAVIIQHELDHLMGTVLLDKVSAFRRSRYLQKVRARRVPARA